MSVSVISNTSSATVSNTTAVGGDPDPNTVEIVISAICAAILLYLTLCQIVVFVYRVKNGDTVWKARHWSQVLSTSNLRYLMSVTLIIAGLFAYAFVILSCTHRVTEISLPVYSVLICCLMLTFSTMYLVLWLRQTSFYTEKAIKHLMHPIARYVSLLQGALIIGGTVVLTAVSVYQVHRSGCDRSKCIDDWLSYLVTSLQLEIQAVLLALFVWPLIKHIQSVKSGARQHRHRRLMRLVKRAIGVTIASIVIDLISLIMYLNLSKLVTVYEVGAVLNLLCTVCCFEDFNARIVPCCLKRKEPEDGENSRSASNERSRAISKSEDARLKTDLV